MTCCSARESIPLPERSSRRRDLSGNGMDDSKAIVLLKILIYSYFHHPTMWLQQADQHTLSVTETNKCGPWPGRLSRSVCMSEFSLRVFMRRNACSPGENKFGFTSCMTGPRGQDTPPSVKDEEWPVLWKVTEPNHFQPDSWKRNRVMKIGKQIQLIILFMTELVGISILHFTTTRACQIYGEWGFMGINFHP